MYNSYMSLQATTQTQKENKERAKEQMKVRNNEG
jgi:hypothetical protein